MLRHALLTATLLLAGCAHAPGLAPVRTGLGVAAMVDTSRHRKAVSVPADVMSYVDDYQGRMHAQYDRGTRSVHMAVKLRASTDGFKHTFEATMGARDGKGAQGFMLDEDAPAGAITYYLVVQGTVVETGPNKLSVDNLPEFFVSDFGKNYQGTAK